MGTEDIIVAVLRVGPPSAPSHQPNATGPTAADNLVKVCVDRGFGAPRLSPKSIKICDSIKVCNSIDRDLIAAVVLLILHVDMVNVHLCSDSRPRPPLREWAAVCPLRAPNSTKLCLRN